MKRFPLLSALVLGVSTAAGVSVGRSEQLVAPDQVPEGLAVSDWEKLRNIVETAQHHFHSQGSDWKACNPGLEWQMNFDRRGFLAQPGSGGWQWGLELKSYGFAGQENSVEGEPTIRADGQRLVYARDPGLEEWFVNDRRGLEHGFTVVHRPVGDAASDLAFTLAIRGGLRPVISANGLDVSFHDDNGAAVVNYSGLKVWDADGTHLESRFVTDGEGVRLLVNEGGARYPITVDPIAQQAYVKAGNTGANDKFGWSVAISVDTVVIGAPYEDSNATGVNAPMFTASSPCKRAQRYRKASTPFARIALPKACVAR